MSLKFKLFLGVLIVASLILLGMTWLSLSKQQNITIKDIISPMPTIGLPVELELTVFPSITQLNTLLPTPADAQTLKTMLSQGDIIDYGDISLKYVVETEYFFVYHKISKESAQETFKQLMQDYKLDPNKVKVIYQQI